MKRIDIILTAVAAALTIFVIIKYPSPRELPEVEAPEAAVLSVSVEEEFIEDVKALPGPAIKEEVKTWQRVEEFTPTDEILLDAADQTTLYYLCKQNNVPMAYALAIIESESDFKWDAVGSLGECGVFQINPVNWEHFESIGIDIHTHAGNLEAGVIMLSECLEHFHEIDGATMGYKCGIYKAKELVAEGVRLSFCDEIVDLTRKYQEVLDEVYGQD